MNNSKTLIEAPSYLAARITRAASSQTYYTIRLLVDPGRVSAAYQAYAYFRWLDDQLDQDGMDKPDRLAFVGRQDKLMRDCYQGKWPQSLLSEQETFLVDLIRGDQEQNSGLRAYIRNLMAVMHFDAGRRGRLISKDELNEYTRHLSVAVTEAMHYFIGHTCKSPQGEARYQAVTAAHITHMLRDTLEDVEAGYFNIPGEIITSQGIDPRDVSSLPYRKWIQSRVEQARAGFRLGKDCLSQVDNARCRLAGYAYSARFEGVLTVIEQDGYRLRSEYPECKNLAASSRVLLGALFQTFVNRRAGLAYPLRAR